MKLSKLFVQISPIDSMEKVNNLMETFRTRNTVITPDMFQKVLAITNPELVEKMSEQMTLFQKNYKCRPKVKANTPRSKSTKNKKRKGIAGNLSSDPMLHRQRALDRMNRLYSTQTLREQGYQYGMSDW